MSDFDFSFLLTSAWFWFVSLLEDAFSSPPQGASPAPESSLTADLLSGESSEPSEGSCGGYAWRGPYENMWVCLEFFYTQKSLLKISFFVLLPTDKGTISNLK